MPKPRPVVFEAKVMIFCPRAVLEVEDSPRRRHPWFRVSFRLRVTTYHQPYEYVCVYVCVCAVELDEPATENRTTEKPIKRQPHESTLVVSRTVTDNKHLLCLLETKYAAQFTRLQCVTRGIL